MKRSLLSYIITFVCVILIIISLVGLYLSIAPKYQEQEKLEEIQEQAVSEEAGVRPVFK